jgi:hypothetical protein
MAEEEARCVAITRKLAREWESAGIHCVVKPPQESFDGKTGPYHACRKSEDEVFLVYPTRKMCLAQVEAFKPED